MSAVLLNCNCHKRISFNLTGGHLPLIWSEFFDIFILSTLWFIMSFFSPHITASRCRDGWRMGISICDIFCRFFFFYFHTIFHSHFQTYFWIRIQSKHPFCNSRGSDILFSLFFFPLVCPQKPFHKKIWINILLLNRLALANQLNYLRKKRKKPCNQCSSEDVAASNAAKHIEILRLVKII